MPFPKSEHRYGSGAAVPWTPDVHDPIRIRKGQGAKDHRTDHREYCCIRSDANGKRGHCGDCEAETLPQKAERVFEVFQERFHCTAHSIEYASLGFARPPHGGRAKPSEEIG